MTPTTTMTLKERERWLETVVESCWRDVCVIASLGAKMAQNAIGLIPRRKQTLPPYFKIAIPPPQRTNGGLRVLCSESEMLAAAWDCNLSAFSIQQAARFA